MWWLDLWRLRSPDPAVRQSAAERLGAGRRQGSRVVDTLVAAMRDDVPAVRLAAAGALRRLGAGESLREYLEDRFAPVRAVAALAAGTRGDPRALEVLEHELPSLDGDARGDAVRILRRFLPGARVLEIERRADVIRMERELDSHLAGLRWRLDTAQGDDPAALHLFPRAERSRVRWQSISHSAGKVAQLAQNRRIDVSRAVEPLLEALRYAYSSGRDSDASTGEHLASTESLNALGGMKRSLIHALGEIADPRAIDLLVELPIDGWGSEQQQRDEALAKMRSPAALAVFSRLLTEHPNRKVRTLVATALGRRGESDAVELLVAALAQARRERGGALPWHIVADSLARVGDRRAVRPLMELLLDGSLDPGPDLTTFENQIRNETGAAVILGLNRITGAHVYDVDKWKAWWSSNAAAYGGDAESA